MKYWWLHDSLRKSHIVKAWPLLRAAHKGGDALIPPLENSQLTSHGAQPPHITSRLLPSSLLIIMQPIKI